MLADANHPPTAWSRLSVSPSAADVRTCLVCVSSWGSGSIAEGYAPIRVSSASRGQGDRMHHDHRRTRELVLMLRLTFVWAEYVQMTIHNDSGNVLATTPHRAPG